MFKLKRLLQKKQLTGILMDVIQSIDMVEKKDFAES